MLSAAVPAFADHDHSDNCTVYMNIIRTDDSARSAESESWNACLNIMNLAGGNHMECLTPVYAGHTGHNNDSYVTSLAITRNDNRRAQACGEAMSLCHDLQMRFGSKRDSCSYTR
jgi:hypothetical protein